MKIIVSILLICTLTSCASTTELKAPCTYDDRKGCGELIYTHENINLSYFNMQNPSLRA